MNVTVIDQNNVKIAVTPTPTQTINIDRGLLGPSGWSGYSGTSGFSGNSTSGYSGYSGAVGQSGYSGFSGQQGTSINVKGEVPTVEDLPPTGNQVNDAYIVTEDGNLWVWNGSAWYDAGQIVGPQGLSGYSGYSGDSTSGYSGYSGETVSGYSGYSGIGESGYSGFSGETVSGYSGYSGDSTSGFSGYSGETVSGYSGYSGESISGFSGYSGSGISGYSGSGISGFSGYSGETISGYSGYSGSGVSGFSGYSGSGVSGYSGYSGSGLSGFSGSGVSGFSGFSGSGVSGYSGYSGIATSGYSGYSGIGTSGYSGYSGAVGAGGTIGNWGSFWDTTTQTTTINTPTPITFNSYDVDNTGISIGSPTSRIVFSNSGTYSLTFSIQFTNTSTANGATQIWLKKNGTNIPDTNSHFDVPDKQGSAFSSEILTVNFVFNVTANDYVQLYWDTTNANVSLETIAGNGTYPRTPSVIFTATQVMYGQSGYSGISGYSGNSTSGYSGFSGYSGSGISGYSGSGISGYSGSGVSGFSGYSGSGLSGFSGYSGSGISGYSGSGVSGFSGFSGSGISGYSGIGTSGYSGYSGITPTIGGSNTQVQYNNSGVLGGSSSLTWDGSFLTTSSIKNSALTSGRVTYAGASGLLTDSSVFIYDTNGNLGIGTNNTGFGASGATRILNLRAGTTAGTSSLTFGDSNAVGYIESINGNGILNINAGNYIQFGAGSSERMRITSAGNVGIGTSTPDVFSRGYTGTIVGISSASGETALMVNSSGTNVVAFEMGRAGSRSTLLYDTTTATEFGTLTSKPLKLLTNGAVVATLDTSGNLGLGVTPSAWNSIYKVVQTDVASIFGSSTYNSLGLGANVFYNASNSPRYIRNDYACFYNMDDGYHIWYTAPSGTAGNAISFTQAMTLDASGNLGVGTTTIPYKLSVADTNPRIYIKASSTGFAVNQYVNDGQTFYVGVNDSTGTFGTAYSSILYGSGAYPMLFYTNSTERMRITSDGFVGIGTSSPSYKLQVMGTIYANNSTNVAYLMQGSQYGGSFANTSTANTYSLGYSTDGSTQTSVLYWNASGRVGIGTISPINPLQVNGAITVSGAYTTLIATSVLTLDYSGGLARYFSLGADASTAGGHAWYGYSSNTGVGTERMRIDSSGRLLVGTTSAFAGNGMSITSNQNTVWTNCTDSAQNGLVVQNSANSTGTSASFVAFNVGTAGSGSTVGSISYNGTTTLYNATSDQRLKENIVDAETALTTLSQIKVRAFDWVDSKKHETHGVIAQELKDVTPQCVTEGINHEDGSIDRPWQVDTSPLVPMLIKAIQEQQALIESLTTRLTTLENK